MNNVTRSQSFRISKSRTFRIMMIFSVIGAIAACMTGVENIEAEARPFTGYAALYTAMDSEYIFMIVGIFASIIFMGDYSSGSIRQIIGKGISRERYVIGTLSSVTFFSLVLLFISDSIAFIMGTVFGEGVGHVPAQEWIWPVVANLIFVFMFTAFTMLVVSVSRKISVTLVIALLTPTFLAGISDIVKHYTDRKWGIDPSSQLTRIMKQDTAFIDRLIPSVAYLAVGCLFVYLSIMTVRKRDL